MTNISERVKQIIDSTKEDFLELGSAGKDNKILFNQRQTVTRIDYYLNNKYLDRNDDAIFWNLSTYRKVHFAKHLTPDTKDFMPYGLGALNQWQAWALRKKVSKWFNDEHFYKTLNSVGDAVATYGSAVWKRYKENGTVKIKKVRLNNIYFDQSIENIKDADGIVEVHQLSEKDLWEKKDVWDNVDKLLEKEDKEVWEFFGYYDDNGNRDYKHIIGSGFGDDYLELWNETVTEEDNPYEDFHVGEYQGRWLRVGVVERLFKLQVRVNQLVNQNAESSEIASLLLLKSANPDNTGNVLEQAINGQIIPDETLQQIGISNTGLNNFLTEIQLIENQADQLCFTPDITLSNTSPSHTSFRGLALMNANAVQSFKDIKQNLLEKIADILMKYVFPDLVKNWNKGDVIEMAEDDGDVEEYTKALNSRVQLEYLLADAGNVVTPEIKQNILNNIDAEIKKSGRSITVPKNFFNFKWGLKMTPTNETVDKAVRNDTYYNLLQMTSANPNITDIPLFKQYCEENGISAWKLTPEQKANLTATSTKTIPSPKQPDKLLQQAKIGQ